MQVVHPICCGIDVHQACLRHVDAAGQAIQDVGEFATTYNALLALLDWFVEAHCPVVARESTGVYSQFMSALNLLSASLTMPLTYCHINSFR
jgi:hypothetical protein